MHNSIFNGMPLGTVAPIWQATNNTLANSHQHSIVPTRTLLGEPVTAPIRRMTPFEKALDKARKTARETEITSGYNTFRLLTSEEAIEIFGGLKPMHAGRPLPWAQMLLNYAPSPMVARSKTARKHSLIGCYAGLVFAYPVIAKKRKMRFRLTGAGLYLLDHWAAKHKSFTPFHAAYVTKKCRREISDITVDVILGRQPKVIKDELAKANVAMEQVMKEEEVKQEMAHQALISYQKTLADTSSKNYQTLLAMSQQQMLSQQGITALMQQQIGQHTHALSSSSLASPLGGLLGKL